MSVFKVTITFDPSCGGGGDTYITDAASSLDAWNEASSKMDEGFMAGRIVVEPVMKTSPTPSWIQAFNADPENQC